MAHGSRRDAANQEFAKLVKDVDANNPNYALTVHALLEQAPPSLGEACKALPEGIAEIDVYPLFFNCGKHVEKDIPLQIAEIMEEMPHCQINLLPYFGSTPHLARWILQHVEDSSREDISDR